MAKIIDTDLLMNIITKWASDDDYDLAYEEIEKIKKLEKDYKILHEFAELTITNNAQALTNLQKEKHEEVGE